MLSTSFCPYYSEAKESFILASESGEVRARALEDTISPKSRPWGCFLGIFPAGQGSCRSGGGAAPAAARSADRVSKHGLPLMAHSPRAKLSAPLGGIRVQAAQSGQEERPLKRYNSPPSRQKLIVIVS